MPCCEGHDSDLQDPSKWGPRKWRELHRGFRSADWLLAWVASLPCPECRAHAETLIAESPPNFTDAEAFFAWTVDFHNAVNARLGKPSLSLAAALAARNGPREEAARRSAVCRSCPHFITATRTASDTCGVSGLALWKVSRCPKNKW